MSALKEQVGGDYYKDAHIQPIEFITANKMNFLEGCIVKRIFRHHRPGGKGVEDIKKLIHEAQLILALYYREKDE